ncbi:N-acetylmuramoyl-L-alanine amidase [Texcoconibacillus texcoconensis]|uniref:N-acetylmuramoyl-L-alanine amidase n=1 Tax=Texcoconibacillus texcoconensis TaxID=1095777 RepID=A0A840QR27_9BACI|nr:N-acetylmuramoyl-L-alanine amidase [Texcoconibacillus texcoconensis]MBB5173788.1 N-acetylmuramoyl-L-alanine amidase [Texcoconibacillus texcoconensis]
MRKLRVVLATGTLTFIMFSSSITAVSAHEEGMITGNNVNIREAPSLESQVIGQLHEDDKLDVYEDEDTWVKVSFEGEEAYVHGDYIAVEESEEAEQDSSDEADSSESEREDVPVIVNDERLSLQREPVFDNNRLVVPFRAISEELGVDVGWKDEEREVHAENGDMHVVFDIDEEKTFVNGEEDKSVDPPPQIIDDYTMIPLRFFSETFGADVSWDEDERIAEITSPDFIDEEEVKSAEEWAYDVEEMVGEVTATVLNVREGPSQSEEVVDKVEEGQEVDVLALENTWAKVDTDEEIGYVHTNYLNLEEGDESVRMLGGLDIKENDDRSVLSWFKIGGLDIDVEEKGQQLYIETDATDVHESTFDGDHIKDLRVDEHSDGTDIVVEVEDNHSFVYRETLGELVVTVLPPGLEGKRIVIDAGHGGSDPGAIANGLEEKEIAKDVSLRIEDLLEDEDVDVIMTRDDDTFVELNERANIANDEFADAFVSIHANSAANESARGSETFWNSHYSSLQSEALAAGIQQQLIDTVGTANRGVFERNFHVVRYSMMPSTLVELGFMTNPADAEKLASDSDRQKMAEAVVEGLEEYYE